MRPIGRDEIDSPAGERNRRASTLYPRLASIAAA
jgi:hypothetical protein